MEVNQTKQFGGGFVPPGGNRSDVDPFPHMEDVSSPTAGANFDSEPKAPCQDVLGRNVTEGGGGAPGKDENVGGNSSIPTSSAVEEVAKRPPIDPSILAAFSSVIAMAKPEQLVQIMSGYMAIMREAAELKDKELKAVIDTVKEEAKIAAATMDKKKEMEDAVEKAKTEELKKRQEIKLEAKEKENELEADRERISLDAKKEEHERDRQAEADKNEMQKLRNEENDRRRTKEDADSIAKAIMAGLSAGAATGLAVGSVGGPIGAGLGAGIGALVGVAAGATKAMFNGN